MAPVVVYDPAIFFESSKQRGPRKGSKDAVSDSISLDLVHEPHGLVENRDIVVIKAVYDPHHCPDAVVSQLPLHFSVVPNVVETFFRFNKTCLVQALDTHEYSPATGLCSQVK